MNWSLVLFAVIFTAADLNLGTLAQDSGRHIHWTHEIKLPAGVHFKWTTLDEEWITMEMSAPTKGYVGIGFSPKGGMAGSDIAMGWVDDSGIVHLRDYYGTHNGVPVEDPQQNLQLLYGFENESGTTIAFKRRWDTCDEHDIAIGEDTMRLIWAWSAVDPKSESQADLHYHGLSGQRGTRSVYMKAPGQPMIFPDNPSYPEPHIQHIDLTVTDEPIPLAETVYHCKVFQFPKVSKKNHIVGYRPLIPASSEPYVHHVNVFNCHVPEALGIGRTKDVFEQYLSHNGADCFGADTPKDWKKYCYALRIATAVGDEGKIYPSDIGDPVGADPEEPTFLLLEVHYENPTKIESLLDNSGMRIFYTDKGRDFDMSMLFVGYRRTPFLTIPPFQKSFTLTGHCAAECINVGFPASGAKIIGLLLHAHLTAKRLILRHTRNGKELEPIAYDNHYDFNYQVYRWLPKPVTVLPGDEIIMDCEYDTEANNTFIFGGLSTQMEMCESFVYYYTDEPPTSSSLVDCRSQPEYFSFLKTLGVQNATGEILKTFGLPFDPAKLSRKQRSLAHPDDSDCYFHQSGTLKDAPPSRLLEDLTIRSPAKLSGRNFQDYIESLNWKDEAFAKRVEKEWQEGPKYMHCAAPGGIRIQNPHHILKISNFEPQDSKESVCKRRLSAGSTGSVTFPSTILAVITIAFNLYRIHI